MCPHFFGWGGGGAMVCLCPPPPTLTPHFYFPLELYVYITLTNNYLTFFIYQLIILWTISINWHRWLLLNNHISKYNSFILVLYRRYINYVSVCPPPPPPPHFLAPCYATDYVLVTTCLHVVSNSYELVTSIYESLRFLAKKYINPAYLNVSSFDNKSNTKLLRVIYGFLRAVYGWLRVVTSGLQYLWIVTSYLRKNQSVDNRQKNFDMSKKLPLLSRILNSFCELLWVVTSYLWIPASYCGWLRVGNP